MKGIILAGGTGSRLYPATLAVSKQLLPVFDKPMIYYPLGVLMLAGIRDILIISTPADLPRFEALLGDGSSLRHSAFVRRAGAAATGLPTHSSLAAISSVTTQVSLILGDNIFYGAGLIDLVRGAAAMRRAPRCSLMRSRIRNAMAWSNSTRQPDTALSIEEKPAQPEVEMGGHRALFL